MAGVVTFDGTRVASAEATTEGWATWGVTAVSAEPDYYYQGSNCISGQVKTAEVGFYWSGSTQVDFATSPKVALLKCTQTNKDAIDGLGLQLFIGGRDTHCYRYEIFSSSAAGTTLTYPIAGGFQLVPIDPNVSGYRKATIGTPSLAAIRFYGIKSDANTTAKAPNLGMDAIDYFDSGRGLSITGTEAQFSNFTSFDEGINTNRYGIVSTRDGIIYALGTLSIGGYTGSVLTTFSDSNKVIVFPNGRFNTGFAGIRIMATNASSNTTLSSCTINGVGRYGYDGSTADTRPNLTITGSVGTASFSACNFNNFNSFTFHSKTTLTNCTFVGCNSLAQNSASMTTCTITSASVAASSSFITADNLDLITYCNFTSGGTGHAIVCSTAGSYTWYNTDSGYTGTRGTNSGSSTGSGNAMFYNNSGGLITLNVAGTGQAPSVRNGVNATTTVNNSVSYTIQGLVVGSEVRFYPTNSFTELYGVESCSTSTITYSYPYTGDQYVNIVIMNTYYTYLELKNIKLGSTVGGTTVVQQFDRWYNNPT